MLKGVTTTGLEEFNIILIGTPTSSISKLGSAVITVRAEKFTRLPIMLPRNNPSFPVNLQLTLRMCAPDLCVAGGTPR